MPLVSQHYSVFQSPGEWMGAVLIWFQNFVILPTLGTTLSYRIDSFQGRSALVQTSTFAGGDSSEAWLVLWPVRTGQLVPVTFLTAAPGWNAVFLTIFDWENYEDPAGLQGQLQSFLVGTVAAFVNEVTPGEVDEMSLSNRQLIDNFILNVVTSYTIASDDDIEACTLKFTAVSSTVYEPGPPLETLGCNSPMPTPYAGSNSQDVAGLMAQLVQAVNAITDQDIEISLNRGAVVFSVRAKVITGS